MKNVLASKGQISALRERFLCSSRVGNITYSALLTDPYTLTFPRKRDGSPQSYLILPIALVREALGEIRS